MRYQVRTSCVKSFAVNIDTTKSCQEQVQNLLFNYQTIYCPSDDQAISLHDNQQRETDRLQSRAGLSDVPNEDAEEVETEPQQ